MLKNIGIIFILIFALFLRSYHLDTLPPALFSDEVDAGYQALIFNQNQTDYYGNKFPTHFHSFSDWRTSLYIYSVAICQKITGPSDIAIRLPSVIFSVLSVYLFYLLTNSLLASLLLAISPWSIHYGRSGFEVSGMLAAIMAGIYFWKKYVQYSRLPHLLLSIFFFALSPYFYSTSKLFLLILAVLIFIIWFSKIKIIKRLHLVLAILSSILLMSPLLIDTIRGQAGYRFSYISIFSEPQLSKTIDNLRYNDIFTTHPNKTGVVTPLTSKIFHNKYGLVFDKFITNYFSAFSTDFLLINGDQNSRHGFATHGLIYYLDFFLIIFGLINVLKNRHSDRLGNLFVWILVLAPIPFSLTRDSLGAHATRLILMLPSLIYLSYQGILYLKYIYKWTIPLIIFIYMVSFASFWHYYNFDYPQESAMSWHTGMKEAVISAKKYQLPIYFSNAYEPFLPFFLYYQPYLPANIPEQNIKHFANNYFDGLTIDNSYFFGNINWSAISELQTPSLFVVPDTVNKEVPNNLKFVEKIDKKYINAQNFYLYTNEQ
ncbi:MAG: glycosyltransferase family 39 protein [Candidatus Shapirobacteria bacterium]